MFYPLIKIMPPFTLFALEMGSNLDSHRKIDSGMLFYSRGVQFGAVDKVGFQNQNGTSKAKQP